MAKDKVEVPGKDQLLIEAHQINYLLRSTENTRKDAPDAKTILIASCITSEAKERISHDTKTIDRFFNLTEVIKDKERYDEFVNLVFSVLGEVPITHL